MSMWLQGNAALPAACCQSLGAGIARCLELLMTKFAISRKENGTETKTSLCSEVVKDCGSIDSSKLPHQVIGSNHLYHAVVTENI